MDAQDVARKLSESPEFGVNGPSIHESLDELVIEAHLAGEAMDPDVLLDSLYARLESKVPGDEQRLVLATLYTRRVVDGLRLLRIYDLR